MNVLITGGCGYIGSHTCVSLIEAGHTPIILDNLINSKASVLDRIHALTGHLTKLYHGDVRDMHILNTIFNAHKIDAVIHFAGLKAVGESTLKPIEYYNNNIYGALILIEAMQNAQVNNLIFSSSATVYGEQPDHIYVETMQTGNPSSPYGRSKLMVEQCLHDIYLSDPKFSISLLRYFNPVGAHPSGTMGEDPIGIPNNLMPFIAQVAVGRRESVAVFGNDYCTPDGTGKRDYIHVVDLAEGHIAALTQKINQPGMHVYNLGSGKGSSVLDVINAFSDACGKPIPYHFMPRRAGDLDQFWANPQKAFECLHWQTRFSLAQMAEDTWRWQSQNPNGYPDKY